MGISTGLVGATTGDEDSTGAAEVGRPGLVGAATGDEDSTGATEGGSSGLVGNTTGDEDSTGAADGGRLNGANVGISTGVLGVTSGASEGATLEGALKPTGSPVETGISIWLVGRVAGVGHRTGGPPGCLTPSTGSVTGGRGPKG